LLQFYTNAKEAESWPNEMLALADLADYGEDEPSSEALLQRQCDQQGKLHAYSGDIASLNSQAEKKVQVKGDKMCRIMEQCVVS
jgi:spectrin beta